MSSRGRWELVVREGARGGPDSIMLAPPGVVHTFSNSGTDAGRALSWRRQAPLQSMIGDFRKAFPPGGGPSDEVELARVLETQRRAPRAGRSIPTLGR